MTKRIFSAILTVVLVLGLFAGVPLKASAVTEMSASDDCIEFIKSVEGFHAIPYWDYAQWTVGFGTACPSTVLQHYLEYGIPVEKAEELLQKALINFNREMNRFMVRQNIQLTQQQYDALFSLSYNCGSAWLYSADNKLVKAVINGTLGNELIYIMGLRSNAGGSFLQGLLHRRMMEADMYLNGRYNASVPADYAIVYYNSGKGSCEAKAQAYDLHLPAEPLAVPTYAGYKFLGWYTSEAGGMKVTALDASTSDMTLYAHWEKIGAADGITGTAIDPVKVKVNASALNVRTGPGATYSVASSLEKGQEVVITAVLERSGTVWGKCSAGWISLAHTTYQPANTDQEEDKSDEIKLPVTGTILAESGVSIYTGPHTSYPKKGTLAQWKEIEVLELRTFMGSQWAKYSDGWIRNDRNLMLDDANKLTHSFTATITNSYLNVRNGPGTDYSLAGSLVQGQKVKIVAIQMVDGTAWGRCTKGWISLQYTDFDASMLKRYQQHTYGQWTEEKAATCTEQGKQSRKCVDCDHVETQIIEVKGHQFGDWYEVKAATLTEKGQQRRDCADCKHYELQDTGFANQPEIHIYGTVTGCEVLNVRSGAGSSNTLVSQVESGDRFEILEQTTVDDKVWGRISKGWICITGYVTVEVVTEEGGETQPEEPAQKVYGTLTGYYTLNIREKAGAGNKLVGTLNKGDRVEILEQTKVGEKTWGRIDRGWICITGYITLETVTEEESGEKPDEKLIMQVTATSLTIRAGAGSQFSAVGYLSNGQQVEILEQKTVDGKTWARIDRGWVSMKYLK